MKRSRDDGYMGSQLKRPTMASRGEGWVNFFFFSPLFVFNFVFYVLDQVIVCSTEWLNFLFLSVVKILWFFLSLCEIEELSVSTLR